MDEILLTVNDSVVVDYVEGIIRDNHCKISSYFPSTFPSTSDAGLYPVSGSPENIRELIRDFKGRGISVDWEPV